MMTVEAIANKSFRRTFLGYDLEEVDDFLDEIIRQIQQMEQERRQQLQQQQAMAGFANQP